MSDGSTAHMPLLLSSRYQNLTVRLDVCEFRVEHWPLTIVLPLFMTQPQPAHSLGLWVFGSSICFWYARVCVCVCLCMYMCEYIHTYIQVSVVGKLFTHNTSQICTSNQTTSSSFGTYIYILMCYFQVQLDHLFQTSSDNVTTKGRVLSLMIFKVHPIEFVAYFHIEKHVSISTQFTRISCQYPNNFFRYLVRTLVMLP